MVTPSPFRFLVLGVLILSWIQLCHVQVFAATGNAVSSTSSSGFQPQPTFVGKNTHHSTPTTNEAFPIDNNNNNNLTTASSNSTNITSVIPEWKRNLPFPLNNKTHTLQRIVVPGMAGRSVEIYLLGTAHVSTDSSRDVRLLLEAIEPDIIFLELCDQRIPMMVMPAAPSQKAENTNTTPTPTENTVAAVGKERVGFWQRLRRKKPKTSQSTDEEQQEPPPPPPQSKSMYSVAATLLTNMQEDYAQSLGVELGGEFRVAYEYWDETCKALEEINGFGSGNTSPQRVHMILGDRPLYLTLTRAWESLRLWGKAKLLIGLLLSSFQRPDPKELQEWMQSILLDDSGDLLSKSIAELAQHFPTLEEVIIRERDAYMACKLYQTCRHVLSAKGGTANQTHRIVAIVGAGHVQGICKWLTDGPSNTGESPEQILTRLVQLKKNPMAEEDLNYLVHDIMEVNPELLRDLLKDKES
ncbi:TraB family protein [Nitzschia inconspicua]|uniref:TraB family protein n=1 Tax=Nitzschia inconspicua TaxID=303405 RepID=A0A9K3KTV7_9STRA|nr:TraB family protein [Nitzschia inconspicua]